MKSARVRSGGHSLTVHDNGADGAAGSRMDDEGHTPAYRPPPAPRPMPVTQNRKLALGMGAAAIAVVILGVVLEVAGRLVPSQTGIDLLARAGLDTDADAARQGLWLFAFIALPLLAVVTVRWTFRGLTGLTVPGFLPWMAGLLVVVAAHALAERGRPIDYALGVVYVAIVGAWLAQQVDKRPKFGTPLAAVERSAPRWGGGAGQGGPPPTTARPAAPSAQAVATPPPPPPFIS